MMPGRQGPIFLAAFEDRYTLAWVEIECWIKGMFYVFKYQQLLGGELAGHFAQFFDPYTVLAGDAASGSHREVKNFSAE